METQELIERIKAIKADMGAIEKRINHESLTLEEINTLEDDLDILAAELSMYEEMFIGWGGPEYEEPPPSDDEEEEQEKEEGEIDYTNPPEWLVKKWDEERDSWTNWNAYSDATFDLADEV